MASPLHCIFSYTKSSAFFFLDWIMYHWKFSSFSLKSAEICGQMDAWCLSASHSWRVNPSHQPHRVSVKSCYSKWFGSLYCLYFHRLPCDRQPPCKHFFHEMQHSASSPRPHLLWPSDGWHIRKHVSMVRIIGNHMISELSLDFTNMLLKYVFNYTQKFCFCNIRVGI